MASDTQELEILYQNVRGLRTRVQQFYMNTLLNHYDIIAVTETWLHQGIYNGELFEQNYVVFRKDREETECGPTRGGGLILAIDKKILAERYRAMELQDTGVEQIWIRIQVRKNSWLYIGLFYFPPGTDRGEYSQIYDKITSHGFSTENILLLGDFNLPLFDNHNARNTTQAVSYTHLTLPTIYSV